MIADLTTWWPDDQFDPRGQGVEMPDDLDGADLRGANLRHRNLAGVRMRRALSNRFTEWPEGFDWGAAGAVTEEEHPNG